jgi:hypothetical protein
MPLEQWRSVSINCAASFWLGSDGLAENDVLAFLTFLSTLTQIYSTSPLERSMPRSSGVPASWHLPQRRIHRHLVGAMMLEQKRWSLNCRTCSLRLETLSDTVPTGCHCGSLSTAHLSPSGLWTYHALGRPSHGAKERAKLATFWLR